MQRDIQPADPKYRLLFLGCATAAVLFGLGGIFYLESYLRDLPEAIRSQPEEAAGQLLLALRLALFVAVLLILTLAAVLLRSGWGSWRSGRYPPPGAKVLRATPILRGPAARRRGQLAVLCGLLLIVLGLWVPWSSYQRLRQHLEIRVQELTTVPVEVFVN